MGKQFEKGMFPYFFLGLENMEQLHWNLYMTQETSKFASLICKNGRDEKSKWLKNAAAGDRTRVTRVTGGNTHHYTTTTLDIENPYNCKFLLSFYFINPKQPNF